MRNRLLPWKLDKVTVNSKYKHAHNSSDSKHYANDRVGVNFFDSYIPRPVEWYSTVSGTSAEHTCGASIKV